MDEKYIYDSSGQLVKDTYTIPFELPKGLKWPFTEIKGLEIVKPKKNYKKIYKPVSVLKLDVRGNVYKGLYLKSLFKIKNCVIKQGNKHMSSEETGRDMYDRLFWQYQLYQELATEVPMPEIYDLFQEDGDTFLVMEYIEGRSLFDRTKELNDRSMGWRELPSSNAVLLLDYLIKIASLIARLHKRGYVHRDVVPGNFLVDKNDKILLIDMELAYSLGGNTPTPPFKLGTPGFMSPEQLAVSTPTVKEDIYGLGATILEVLVGITPIRFDINKSDTLYDSMSFFLGDPTMAELITRCLNLSPEERPDIDSITNILVDYRHRLQANVLDKQLSTTSHLNSSDLKNLIILSLQGLNQHPTVIKDDVWYSKVVNIENLGTRKNLMYSRYTGLSEGIGGVLYLLARARIAGFSIDAAMAGYKKGWSYIQEDHTVSLQNQPPGLYEGIAGIALSMMNGIHAGLIEDNRANREKLQEYLEFPVTGLDLATGLAGQGISILRCYELLDETFSQDRLDKTVNILIEEQEKDGSWELPVDLTGKQFSKSMSFGFGVTGILWFLLEYSDRFKSQKAQTVCKNALNWISQKTHKMKDLLDQRSFDRNILNGVQAGDERKGIILVLIKAYEVFKAPFYKQAAENVLSHYPSYMVHSNFTQNNGLSGLGELYLEAYRVFNNKEWEKRANWIANLFMHTCIRNSDNAIHWIMEENNDPTADFMLGTSGIIHFLIRCYMPSKIGYRLLY